MPGSAAAVGTGAGDTNPLPVEESGSGSASSGLPSTNNLAPTKIATAESVPAPAIGDLLLLLAPTIIPTGESVPVPAIIRVGTNALVVTKIASGESFGTPGINVAGSMSATFDVKLAGIVDERRLRAKVQIQDGPGDGDGPGDSICDLTVSSANLGTIGLHASGTFDVFVPGLVHISYSVTGMSQIVVGPSIGSGTVTVTNEDTGGSPGETITITLTPDCDVTKAKTVTYVRGP